MTMIHSESKVGTLPELELFKAPATQMQVENTYYVDIHPVSSISQGSVLEFVIGGENRIICI